MKSTNNRSIAGLLSVLASVAMISQVSASQPKLVVSGDDAWDNRDLLVAALFKTGSTSSGGEEAVSMQDGIDYLTEQKNNKWFKDELPQKIKDSTDEADLIKYAGCAKSVESVIVDWADMALNAEVTGTVDVSKALGNGDFIIDVDDEEMKKTQNYKNAQDKLKVMHEKLEASVGKKIADTAKARCCDKGQHSAVRSYLKMNCMIEEAAKASFNEKLLQFAGDLWTKMSQIATYVKDKVQGYINKTFGTSIQTSNTQAVKNHFAKK